MAKLPTKLQVLEALIDAGKTHHEFQEDYLEGVHHDQWAMWYAAFITGRLGNFASATLLTQWILEVNDKEKWFKKTAEHIIKKLETGK